MNILSLKKLLNNLVKFITPYLILVLLWIMDFTAIPGIYLLWWMNKQNFSLLSNYLQINVKELIPWQWPLSLLFLFCYIVSSQFNSETKSLSFSDGHFLPLLIFLPSLMGFSIKILAIVMLLASFLKQFKSFFLIKKDHSNESSLP